jgi:hypothetical protein
LDNKINRKTHSPSSPSQITLSRTATSFSRFVLIQLVVVNHCYNRGDIIFFITSPSLAFLSAFLFVISFKDTRSKLKSIAKNLVVPYLYVNCIYYFAYTSVKVYLKGSTWAESFSRAAPDFSFQGFLEGITINPVNGPFWFLRDLIIAQTLCSFLFVLKARLRIILAFSFLTLLVIILPESRFYTSYCVGLIFALMVNTDAGYNYFNRVVSEMQTKYIQVALGSLCLLCLFYLNKISVSQPVIASVFVGFVSLVLLSLISTVFRSWNSLIVENYSFLIFSYHAMVIGGVRLLLMAIGIGFGVFFDVLSYALTNCVIFLILRFYQLISGNLKAQSKKSS